MDWLGALAKVQAQAQQAADALMSSEAAERARQLAQQATQQATVLAQQATIKAQEVAKEAIGEAEKGLQSAFRPQAPSPAPADPGEFGITPELERFVCSLTYSTFDDYPQDSLDVPELPAQQKLSTWQEIHARLVLQRVPQLQDLRFVLCPRRMDEYLFWLIYFTLCKRYLPGQSEQQAEAAAAAAAGPPAGAPAAAADSAAGSTAGAPAAAAGGAQAGEGDGHGASPGKAPSEGDAAAALAAGSAAAAAAAQQPPRPASPAAASDGGEAGGGAGGSSDDDELAQLADDPELNAYLEDALQLDDKAGGAAGGGDSGDLLGSDMEDLDDYINQLDAEVNAGK